MKYLLIYLPIYLRAYCFLSISLIFLPGDVHACEGVFSRSESASVFDIRKMQDYRLHPKYKEYRAEFKDLAWVVKPGEAFEIRMHRQRGGFETVGHILQDTNTLDTSLNLNFSFVRNLSMLEMKDLMVTSLQRTNLGKLNDKNTFTFEFSGFVIFCHLVKIAKDPKDSESGKYIYTQAIKRFQEQQAGEEMLVKALELAVRSLALE